MGETSDPYQDFRKAAAWRQDLYRRFLHKSLDIAEEDMNITTTTGMGWKELAVGAVVMLAGLGGLAWFMKPHPPVAPPSVSVADTAYDVLFFDVDGNPISIPQAEGTEP